MQGYEKTLERKKVAQMPCSGIFYHNTIVSKLLMPDSSQCMNINTICFECICHHIIDIYDGGEKLLHAIVDVLSAFIIVVVVVMVFIVVVEVLLSCR